MSAMPAPRCRTRRMCARWLRGLHWPLRWMRRRRCWSASTTTRTAIATGRVARADALGGNDALWREGAEVVAHVRLGCQGIERRVLGHAAAMHEQEPLADLAQDIELERRGRVQAHEHQPLLAAQLAEEI